MSRTAGPSRSRRPEPRPPARGARRLRPGPGPLDRPRAGRQDRRSRRRAGPRPHGRRATLAGRPGGRVERGPPRRPRPADDGRDPRPVRQRAGLGDRATGARGVLALGGDRRAATSASTCAPESYADGRLVVRTDSTAWATQMKLLAPDVVRRLNEVLGEEHRAGDRRGGTPRAVVETGPAPGQGPGAQGHLRVSRVRAAAARGCGPERPRARMGSPPTP